MLHPSEDKCLVASDGIMRASCVYGVFLALLQAVAGGGDDIDAFAQELEEAPAAPAAEGSGGSDVRPGTPTSPADAGAAPEGNGNGDGPGQAGNRFSLPVTVWCSGKNRNPETLNPKTLNP